MTCAASARRLPGIIDLTPGIRSLQIHFDARAPAARRAARRCCASRGRAAARSTTSRCRRASCTCRCRGTTRRRSSRSRSTCSRCAPTRPGARATSSSSAASTASTRIEDVQRHRLRRELPGAGPGRRLPRRAGRDAARSAPSPGHHQVQPGAHLDAGERGRHRRRVPVRLRHGRARAATSSSAAPCRCGTAIAQTRGLRATASRGCCASSIRSASTRSASRSCSSCATRLPARPARSCRSRRRRSAWRDYRAFLRDHATSIDAFKRTPAGRVRGRARTLGRDAAAARAAERRRRRRAEAGAEALPAGATAVRAEVPGSVWQLLVKPGDRVRAGDRVAVLETMKMETPVAAPADGTVIGVHCAPGGQVVPGQLLMTLAGRARAARGHPSGSRKFVTQPDLRLFLSVFGPGYDEGAWEFIEVPW